MDIHVINKLKFSLSKPPFISFIIAIFALLFAFYLQYILGHEPCKLCMYQRYVYILVILLSLLGFFLHKSKLIPILLIILFIIITSIGFWHLGIEQQWWAASLECSGITQNIGSLKEEVKNISLKIRKTIMYGWVVPVNAPFVKPLSLHAFQSLAV